MNYTQHWILLKKLGNNMSTFLNQVVSFPYYFALKLRNKYYDNGTFKSFSFNIPIISVGDVTVGGTGKTPLTELIVKMTCQEYRIAVLSRGYGRKSKGFIIVSENDSSKKTGDEPLQIKRKFPQIIVAIDKNRKRGIEQLTALPAETKPQLIILDDAFQHRRVIPTQSIVLINYNRPIFKDKLIPFGKLRDLPTEIKRAQTVIITKAPDYLDEWEREKCAKMTMVRNSQLFLFSKIVYKNPLPIFPEIGDNRYIYSKEVILFTGIAEDKPIMKHIIGDYTKIIHLKFSDHHNFTKHNIRHITTLANNHPLALILTTEKDAQRMLCNPYISNSLKVRLFYLPIEVAFLTQEEENAFKDKILSSIR